MPTQTEVIVTDEEYEAYEAEQGQAVAAARAKMERETPKLRVNHGKRPGQDWRRKRPEGGVKRWPRLFRPVYVCQGFAWVCWRSRFGGVGSWPVAVGPRVSPATAKSGHSHWTSLTVETLTHLPTLNHQLTSKQSQSYPEVLSQCIYSRSNVT